MSPRLRDWALRNATPGTPLFPVGYPSPVATVRQYPRTHVGARRHLSAQAFVWWPRVRVAGTEQSTVVAERQCDVRRRMPNGTHPRPCMLFMRVCVCACVRVLLLTTRLQTGDGEAVGSEATDFELLKKGDTVQVLARTQCVLEVVRSLTRSRSRGGRRRGPERER